jgi:hypothetical protein
MDPPHGDAQFVAHRLTQAARLLSLLGVEVDMSVEIGKAVHVRHLRQEPGSGKSLQFETSCGNGGMDGLVRAARSVNIYDYCLKARSPAKG